MVDHIQTVCCMCGDVGFPDKLFHCSKCRNRFQHSYCSNYYSEYAEPIDVCDWCQSEVRNSTSSSSSSSSISSRQANSFASNSRTNSKTAAPHANGVRSAYSGDKIKQHNREEGGTAAEKATGKSPSPRTTTRRYKLLKDVMC